MVQIVYWGGPVALPTVGGDLAVTWAEGDAEALPYADGTFDVVLSCLGVGQRGARAAAARRARDGRPGAEGHRAGRHLHHPRGVPEFFKTNYGPTGVAYRGIAEEPDRVAALDADLAALARRFDVGGGAMEWEYLLFTARRAG